MKLTSLELSQFRNYEKLNIGFHENINLFCGDNAQGKTNILEAIYLAGTTKSHRSAKDREMIRFDQDESHIRMEMEVKNIPYRVDMHLRRNRKKETAINGLPVKKAGELVGLGHFVFFSPEDLKIIKNGPLERRRFMDMELCQLSSVYIHDLAGYQHVLAQRSALLKDFEERGDIADTLDVWDEQLVLYGQKVIEARQRFADLLGEVIKPIHSSLSGGTEELEVLYEKNTDGNDFSERLKEEREKDIRFKITGSGPHRDDLMIKCNGIDLRRYGSQGQQRTAALSMKLAEIELVRRIRGESPVLLLDDVLSELDQSRQTYLLQQISRTQTLITCTGMDYFNRIGFHADRIFCVKDAKVSVS